MPTETIVEQPTNPIKAIRHKCLDCCGHSPQDVKDCHIVECTLHPFRLGKNPYRTPRVMSDEQRAAATERFARARAAKETTP